MLAADFVNIGANTVTITEVLARQRLVTAHDRLGAAKINNDIAILDALYGAIHDLMDAILIFAILAVALSLTYFLNDHLFGVLRGNATEIKRRQRLGDKCAQLSLWILLFRLLKRYLCRVHRDVFNNF